MPIAVIYIAAGLLFLGAAHDLLPYGYFTFLRIVSTVVFIWAFLVSLHGNRSFLPWIYLLLAITFNPIVKVPLPSELWMFVDIAAGSLLLFIHKNIKQQLTAKVI
jgi:hypothetical protein